VLLLDCAAKTVVSTESNAEASVMLNETFLELTAPQSFGIAIAHGARVSHDAHTDGGFSDVSLQNKAETHNTLTAAKGERENIQKQNGVDQCALSCLSV
jgi:hypothetical protein